MFAIQVNTNIKDMLHFHPLIKLQNETNQKLNY